MELVTPMTASHDFAPGLPTARPHSRTSDVSSLQEPATALRTTTYDTERLLARQDQDRLPSPVPNLTARLRADSKDAADRKNGRLAVQIVGTRYTNEPSLNSQSSAGLDLRHGPSTGGSNRFEAASPSLTDRSGKTRAIDDYISSVEEARSQAKRDRAQSRKRGESRKREGSRPPRASSRARDASTNRGRDNVRYIKPSKRSPASPLPMSPEEIAKAGQKAQLEPATTEDEDFYKVASPTASSMDLVRNPTTSRPESRPARPSRRASSRSRPQSPEDGARGRTNERGSGALGRSPSMPLPTSPEKHANAETDDTESDGRRFRIRAASSSSRRPEDLQTRRAASREGRSRSADRAKHTKNQESVSFILPELAPVKEGADEERESVSSLSNTSGARRRPTNLSRKELAAKELEDRRLSLARRPSAPTIPLPGESYPMRPGMAPRSHTELGDSPSSSQPPLLSRSQTANPELKLRPFFPTRSGAAIPPMGLPATPKPVRNPRSMGADERESVPRVPEIPDAHSDLVSSVAGGGSYLSKDTESNIESDISGLSSVYASQPSYLTQASSTHPEMVSGQPSVLSSQPSELSSFPSLFKSETDEDVGPLLPSSVFGQTSAPPPRSASVPSEAQSDVHPAYKSNLPHTRRLSQMRNNIRMISPPELPKLPGATLNIDEALRSDDEIIIVSGSTMVSEVSEPPILPELQHLAGPPPPPPPPTMFAPPDKSSSDVINITMDGTPGSEVLGMLPSSTYCSTASQSYPQPMERASTASPLAHRRGRGSVSETFGSRFRGVTDRMRSQSRSRNTKSPPVSGQHTALPYETGLPPMAGLLSRRESLSKVARAKSPYEQAMAAGNQDTIKPPLPPTSPVSNDKINETSIPPTHLPSIRSGSTSGCRNPKEIRANMPPETLQQGVYNGGFL